MDDIDSIVNLRLITRNIRLVNARKEKGWHQIELARILGKSTCWLSAVENLRSIPTDNQIDEISVALEKPVDWLFPQSLIDAINLGVFKDRQHSLEEPEIISLIEAQRLRLSYDGETALIDEVAKAELREQIEEVLATLKPRERKVIGMRFGFEGNSMTLEQVGKYFNVTRERIRQIENKALRILRLPSRSRRLKDYLD